MLAATKSSHEDLLIAAAEHGHTKKVQALLAQGADVNHADQNGWTALMSAAQNGHTKTVQALFARGADVNHAKQDGWTALMSAVAFAHTETVLALLAQGAEVKHAMLDGRTALMLAVQFHRIDTVWALLAVGAMSQETSVDETVLALNQEIAKVLRKAERISNHPINEFSALKNKAEILREKGHADAYQSAMEIYITLVRAYEKFQEDGDRQAFNDACIDIIAKKRPILDKHRGWSEFLVNLAIAISTLGSGLLIKGAMNVTQSKSFFFVHKTDTGKIVDEIQKNIGNILALSSSL